MKKLENNSKLNLVITAILLIMLVVAWSGTASGLSKKQLKRTDKKGPVTITAIFMNPIDKENNSDLRFEIKLDTHSVDLAQYNLEELSSIRFDNGLERKSNGVSQKGSGHHITNVLRFPGPVPNGAKNMTLIIRNVGDVAERLLEWKLPIQ